VPSLASKASVLFILNPVMLWSSFLSGSLIVLAVVASSTQPAALGWLLLLMAGLMMLYYYLLGFYWGSLALFVVFVGGLLVAFSFISATASNWTLVEYYSLVWWFNVLVSILSLTLVAAPFGSFSHSSAGLMTTVRSVVGCSAVAVFWVCVVALLLVLLAGVKMCIRFFAPLHWAK